MASRREPATTNSADARRGSPGFGVSATSPREPREKRSRTAGGSDAHNPDDCDTRTASANGDGSGTPGPEPITAGSSSTGAQTSDSAKVTDRPARAPSCPPLIADRCFRTAFMSPIASPLASSARVTAILSSSEMPSAGHHHIAPARPDSTTTSTSPRRAAASASTSARRPDSALSASGIGCAPQATNRSRTRSRWCSTNPSAIGRAALPAATTVNCRFEGNEYREAARSRSRRASPPRSAASSNARASRRRSERGEERGSVILPLLRGREPRDDVELSEQGAHHLVGIVFRAEVFELVQDLGDRAVGIGDGAFRKVLTLPGQPFRMLEDLFAVEVGQENRCARNPNRADHACCHATPRLGHSTGWIESKWAAFKLSTNCNSSTDRARHHEPAEASERHPANDQEQQHLRRHERHTRKPDGVGHDRSVARAEAGKGRRQEDYRDDRPEPPLDEPLCYERAADVRERRPHQLHDFNFVLPRQGRQPDDVGDREGAGHRHQQDDDEADAADDANGRGQPRDPG